ncbi:MAG: YceI family protein [Chloroflexi bacterium]|nr:YceI family protein [Chloroflexota bacterium]
MRIQISLILIVSALVLAACAVPSAEPAAEAVAPQEDTAPAEEPQAEEAEPVAEDAEEAASSAVVFSIVSADSEARFYIDEVLRGEDVTVVGITNEVSGEITVDFENPSTSSLGPITINADTLMTDADGRNRALRQFILQTGQFPEIVFAPTSFDGLPEAIEFGTEYPISITGDLTIKDVTQTVTFEGTVTPVNESQIEGLAATTILYADYGITIPSVPFVASVEDDVILEFAFVAAP